MPSGVRQLSVSTGNLLLPQSIPQDHLPQRQLLQGPSRYFHPLFPIQSPLDLFLVKDVIDEELHGIDNVWGDAIREALHVALERGNVGDYSLRTLGLVNEIDWVGGVGVLSSLLLAEDGIFECLGFFLEVVDVVLRLYFDGFSVVEFYFYGA